MGAERDLAFNVKAWVPESVNQLFDLFEANGFELYAVGGCIRNLLLQREPKDWDFATSALTTEMIQMCEKLGLSYLPTGIEYGTLTLVIDKHYFEITTFRVEGRYSGRAPSELSFSRHLHEDLKRRDFTMNAIAWSPQTGLIDLFGGFEDIKNSLIRIIGNGQRFVEDPLRVMRAARFVSELGFCIEPSTLSALSAHRSALTSISQERIAAEMNKLLLGEHVLKGLFILNTSGILKIILPEVERLTDFDQKSPYHDRELFTHLASTVQHTGPVLTVRWAALLHDIGKPDCMTLDEMGVAHYYGHQEKSAQLAEKLLERFFLSKVDQKKIVLLIEEHMTLDESIGKKGIKRLLGLLSVDGMEDLINLTTADKYLARSRASTAEANQFNTRIKDLVVSILEHSEPFEMSQLAITGTDLIALGVPVGKRIGEMKSACLAYVLEHPEMNVKETLILWIQSEYKQTMEVR